MVFVKAVQLNYPWVMAGVVNTDPQATNNTIVLVDSDGKFTSK